MLPAYAELLRVRLPCEPSAPRQARHALQQLDAIAPVLEDVLLVASELTSNAIRHSGSAPGSKIELHAGLVADSVLIEVIDEGRSDTSPRLRPTNASLPGGFGLSVVAALARRWGSERREGLRVWAELPL